MKKIILLALLWSSIVYADEDIVPITEGEPAPFSGTLLSTEAAARILATSELAEARCDARVEKEVALIEAQKEYELEILSAQLETCKVLREEQVLILEGQNEFLLTEIKRLKRPRGVWFFVGGVVVGTAMSVGTLYAINPVISD